MDLFLHPKQQFSHSNPVPPNNGWCLQLRHSLILVSGKTASTDFSGTAICACYGVYWIFGNGGLEYYYSILRVTIRFVPEKCYLRVGKWSFTFVNFHYSVLNWPVSEAIRVVTSPAHCTLSSYFCVFCDFLTEPVMWILVIELGLILFLVLLIVWAMRSG